MRNTETTICFANGKMSGLLAIYQWESYNIYNIVLVAWWQQVNLPLLVIFFNTSNTMKVGLNKVKRLMIIENNRSNILRTT